MEGKIGKALGNEIESLVREALPNTTSISVSQDFSTGTLHAGKLHCH